MKKAIYLLRSMSITRRLILYFTFLLLVQMVLIGWVSYNWASSYLENGFIQKTQELNGSIVQQINYIRINGEELSDRVLANRTVQQLLLKNYDSGSGTEMLNDKNMLERQLFDPKNIVDTAIIGVNGEVYQSRSGVFLALNSISQVTGTDVYAESLSSYGNNIWVASAGENLMSRGAGPYLYVCRTIKAYLDEKFKKLGQLIIQIPYSSLDGVFSVSSLAQGEYYAITDSSGTVIYNSLDSGSIGNPVGADIRGAMTNGASGYKTIKSGKEKALVTYSKYDGDGWDVIHVLPLRVISAQAGVVRNFILLILLLSLAITLPLLLMIARAITQPIGRLMATMEKFGNGNLAVRSDVRRTDEIGHLQASFNTMAEDINGLMEKNADEHRQRRLTELNLMEYQINPHFLYNSLDSINWMAQKAGNEDIEEMVTALAKFFRVGLSRGRELYRIRDELEHAGQYLLINKIRFKDCFSYSIESDPEILDCLTMKILLQPIIENAIKYGIDKNGTNGSIEVTAVKEEGAVALEVRDNGAGIPEERLQTIRNVLAKHTPIEEGSVSGFGLFNVNQRIRMQCGEGYGITLDSSQANGTTVRIRIPLVV